MKSNVSRFPGISVLCQHLNLFQRVSRLEIHYFYRTGNVGYNIYLATVNCQIISRISQSPVIDRLEIIAYHSLVIERKTHQRTVILIEQSFAQRIEFGCIRLCRVTCDVR